MSKEENICSVIAKYPNMEICSIDEKSRNNINLRCLVCGYQEFMEKQKIEFVEISLSGMEYSSRTLKNIDSNIAFSKVDFITIFIKSLHYIFLFTNLKFKII